MCIRGAGKRDTPEYRTLTRCAFERSEMRRDLKVGLPRPQRSHGSKQARGLFIYIVSHHDDALPSFFIVGFHEKLLPSLENTYDHGFPLKNHYQLTRIPRQLLFQGL